MANNIDIKFSGQVELRAAKYLYTGVDGNDCFRAIHTNFYNSAFVYNPSEMVASSITNPGNAFDRDLLTTYANWTSNRSYTLNNYRFRPQTIIVDMTTGLSSPAVADVYIIGFDDQNQFTLEISDGASNVTGNGGPPTRLIFDNVHKQFPELRRGWCNGVRISTPNNVRLYQLFVYGEIIHEQELKLPPTPGATTIEAFTDSFVGVDPTTEGSIIKDGSLQVSPRRAHTIQRVSLTGDYDIPDDAEANVFNFDPNGFNRIVNLPRSPQFNHYIRINNINGAFQIRVNDSDHSTLVQNLSNADGPNTIEAVWANTQWIVTT